MSSTLQRGDYGFRITQAGGLEDCPQNVELLRRLWIGRELVSGEDLGPGDPGDYDCGAWHVSCHLVAAGGVLQLADGGLAWLEVSHRGVPDEYYASCTFESEGTSQTIPLDSPVARDLLTGSRILGFVEGPSVGRISALGVTDRPDRFNGNPRQEYDQSPESTAEGGKVWEHWCTLRDIRESASVGLSVLKAYVTLCSVLGDRFVAVVARGRRAYGHPVQLHAYVVAGFISPDEASWVPEPAPIPDPIARLFLEASPDCSLKAINGLNWTDPPRYWMFARSICQWNAGPVNVN